MGQLVVRVACGAHHLLPTLTLTLARSLTLTLTLTLTLALAPALPLTLALTWRGGAWAARARGEAAWARRR